MKCLLGQLLVAVASTPSNEEQIKPVECGSADREPNGNSPINQSCYVVLYEVTQASKCNIML